MKAPRIILPVLLIATCMICWLSISIESQSSQARIKVESDSTDIANAPGRQTANNSSYDPFFIQENRMPTILIPGSKLN
jgi:hypothetical protein